MVQLLCRSINNTCFLKNAGNDLNYIIIILNGDSLIKMDCILNLSVVVEDGGHLNSAFNTFKRQAARRDITSLVPILQLIFKYFVEISLIIL